MNSRSNNTSLSSHDKIRFKISLDLQCSEFLRKICIKGKWKKLSSSLAEDRYHEDKSRNLETVNKARQYYLNEAVIHRVNGLRLQLPGIRMNFRCYPPCHRGSGEERFAVGSLNSRGLEREAVHHPLQLNWVNTKLRRFRAAQTSSKLLLHRATVLSKMRLRHFIHALGNGVTLWTREWTVNR